MIKILGTNNNQDRCDIPWSSLPEFAYINTGNSDYLKFGSKYVIDKRPCGGYTGQIVEYEKIFPLKILYNSRSLCTIIALEPNMFSFDIKLGNIIHNIYDAAPGCVFIGMNPYQRVFIKAQSGAFIQFGNFEGEYGSFKLLSDVFSWQCEHLSRSNPGERLMHAEMTIDLEKGKRDD